MKLAWKAQDWLLAGLSRVLARLSRVTMRLLERKMARGMVRVPVADAVAELSRMHVDSPAWMAVRGGMIDHLQRGWVEPYRSPEGELRFKQTAKGKAYAQGSPRSDPGRDEVTM